MLVGRDEELKAFFEALTQDQRRIIAVRGATGRGKSEFLRNVAAELRAGTDRAKYRPAAIQNANLICGLREIKTDYEDRAYSLVSVLLQIAAAVAQVSGKRPQIEVVAKETGKDLFEHVGEIGAALVKDLGSKFAPETIAKVVELLGGIVPQASLEKALQSMLGSHQRPDVEDYIELLELLAKQTEPQVRFALMFDNVQIADATFFSALKYVGRRMPDRFYAVYAFNDESDLGREFEKRHWKELKALGQVEIEIPPMEAPQVRKWIESEKGSKIAAGVSQQLLESVCEATDGRPIYIGMWMRSPDFQARKVKRRDELDGYFQSDFGALSKEAAKMAQLTALLPGPLPGGCGDYAAIFETRAEEVDRWSLELQQGLIIGRSRERPWFRHSLVQTYLRERELPGEVRKSLAGQAVKALGPRAAQEPGAYLPHLAALLAETEQLEACVDANHELARVLINRGEYYAALAALERAEKAAKKSEDKEERAWVLVTKAEIHDCWGNPEETERAVAEAEGIAPADSKVLSAVLHVRGILQQGRGDYDGALQLYQKSLEIKERLGDLAGMSASYHQMGNVKYLRGDYDDALSLYQKSLDIKEQLGNLDGMSTGYHQMGIVKHLRGDYDGALALYQKSLDINVGLGNKAGTSKSYGQMGIVKYVRGDYDGALELCQRSLEICEQLGDLVGMSKGYHQMGMVKKERGDHDAALGLYQKSLDIKERLGDLAGMSKSYHEMGIVKQHCQDYDGALKLYRQSLEIKERLGDLAGMGASYHQIGNVKYLRGDYDGALQLYQQSLEIQERLGDLAGMSASYGQMSNLQYSRKDYDGAIALYQKSIVIQEKLGDLAGMSKCYRNVGIVHRAEGRKREACEYFRRSAECFRKMKLPVPEDLRELLEECSGLEA